MSKFDPAEVLKGSIPDVTANLGDHDDTQLKALHDHESKNGNRDGMLKAIHAEQSNRELTAKTKAAIETASKDGVKLFSQADVDAARAENPDRQAIDAEHKKAIDDLQADHGQRIADLEAQLKKANGRQPAKARTAKPRKLSITGEGQARGATRVAFTDAEDTTIVGLPELEFGEGDFTRSVSGLTLDQPIRFPEAVSRSEVSKVWLVDGDGKAVAVSPLVNPLPVGGGSVATIPAGYLAFRTPEPTDMAGAEAEAA